MATPDPASVLTRQNALFGRIDDAFDQEIPIEFDLLPTHARAEIRQWLTGPLLTLGRQLVHPPEIDNATTDRVRRVAAYLLRLAHQAAHYERLAHRTGESEPPPHLQTAQADGEGLSHLKAGQQVLTETSDPDELPEQVIPLISELEYGIEGARTFPSQDRAKLKAVMRELAEPLLPRTHDEQVRWVLDGIEPELRPSADANPDDGAKVRAVRGKNIDAQMVKVMLENQESAGWSAQQWADRLGCAKSTIAGTKTWKERLNAVRAMQAADAASRMDRSRPHPKGRQRRKPN